MRCTYIASANNTVSTQTLSDGSSVETAGAPLGASGQDVLVYKIIIGLPVANGNIVVFNKAKAMAFATDTSNIAAKITLPATITYQFTTPVLNEWDFGPEGLQLDGGNIQIDQTMQITVIWDYANK